MVTGFVVDAEKRHCGRPSQRSFLCYWCRYDEKLLTFCRLAFNAAQFDRADIHGFYANKSCTDTFRFCASLSATTVEGTNTQFSIVFIVFRDTRTSFASAAWVRPALARYFFKLFYNSAGIGPLTQNNKRQQIGRPCQSPHDRKAQAERDQISGNQKSKNRIEQQSRLIAKAVGFVTKVFGQLIWDLLRQDWARMPKSEKMVTPLNKPNMPGNHQGIGPGRLVKITSRA